jgi:hypothetical protein
MEVYYPVCNHLIFIQTMNHRPRILLSISRDNLSLFLSFYFSLNAQSSSACRLEEALDMHCVCTPCACAHVLMFCLFAKEIDFLQAI